MAKQYLSNITSFTDVNISRSKKQIVLYFVDVYVGTRSNEYNCMQISPIRIPKLHILYINLALNVHIFEMSRN